MNTIVYDSELKFRKYLIKNSDDIINVIILEDKLDNIIYFYSFTNNNFIISSKEYSKEAFEYYSKIYKNLLKKLKLDIEYNSNNPKVLKLIKNN